MTVATTPVTRTRVRRRAAVGLIGRPEIELGAYALISTIFFALCAVAR